MTTSVESENAMTASGRNAAIVAGIAMLAIAGGGWYWWSQRLITVSGIMKCESIGDSLGFERKWNAEIKGTEITMNSGDWAEQGGFFDRWIGTVIDGRVEMSGDYREGAPTLKKGKLSGTFDGNTMMLEGTRGSRPCSFQGNV